MVLSGRRTRQQIPLIVQQPARELELMVDYGMKPLAVLQSVTAGNAEIMHLQNLGRIKAGLLSDIIAVEGNPVNDITTLRNVQLVMKNGVIYKKP